MENTLYWVFSTIVQAFVALLALVGMVGIYKISNLRSYIQLLEREIELLSIKSAKLLPFSSERDSNNHKEIEKEKDFIKDIKISANKEEKRFKKSFARFALITIGAIAISLISLIFTTILAKAHYILIGVIITSVSTLSLLSLRSAYLLMKSAIFPDI